MDDYTRSMRRVFEALKFAAEKHRNQRRKDREASPYINHPIDICHYLCGCCEPPDPDLLVAAALHDTVEDTNTTLQELAERFGDEIERLVEEVTDDKTKPKEVRKELQIRTARNKSPKAKLIKLADKISNVTDIIRSPPHGWSSERKLEYLEWTEKVVRELEGTNECLESLYFARLKEARNRLGRTAGEDKNHL